LWGELQIVSLPDFAALVLDDVAFAAFGTGAAFFTVIDFFVTVALLAPEAGPLALATTNVAWATFLATFVTAALSPFPFDFVVSPADCLATDFAPSFVAFAFSDVALAAFGTGAAFLTVVAFLATVALAAPGASPLALATTSVAWVTFLATFVTAASAPVPFGTAVPPADCFAPDFAVFVAFATLGKWVCS
jgi:hypothetical protein